MIYREPYGVALIIGPFNGPLLLLIRPALAALAAGNTCILTLSEALPATTEVLLELVPKYFDPGAVTVVAGGKEQNTELLKLPFDFIFFTGSTFVGKIVARAAAETPHACPARTRRDEPGGRGRDRQHPRRGEENRLGRHGLGRPMVHLAGIRLRPRVRRGRLRRRGQEGAGRAFWQRPEIQFRLFAHHQRARGRAAGLAHRPAKVIAGGKSDPEAHYLDPTLLYPITWDDKIMEDEIFGPILPILTYKSFDEAMARMARHRRPLAGFIFSRDQKDHRPVHRRAVLRRRRR